jgi:hypothetical protein
MEAKGGHCEISHHREQLHSKASRKLKDSVF